VMKVSASFVNSPVTNPAAQEWINSQTNTWQNPKLLVIY
jgi:hypothetical protein